MRHPPPLTPRSSTLDGGERCPYGRGDRVGVAADEDVGVRFEQGPDVVGVSCDRVLDVSPRLTRDPGEGGLHRTMPWSSNSASSSAYR